MNKLRRSYALDDKDITIIRMLLHDGRATDTELAQAIGRTRPIVATRRKALEQAGVIKGYRAEIDWSKVAESGCVWRKIKKEMKNEKSTDDFH